MERKTNIDVVRCIANYIIVVLHAGAAFQYCFPSTIEYKFWTYLCWDLCCVALPAMFLISGYLMFSRFHMATYPKKMSNRIKRLVIPYFAWNISFVIFYLVMGHFVPRLNARVSSFGLDSYSGAFEKICSLTVSPIDGPLWFIRTLFILSLCSPILWIFLKSKTGRIMGGALIMLAYVLSYYLDLLPSMALTYPLYGITTFYFGGVLAVTNDYYASFKWFKSKMWLIPSFVGILLLGYTVYLNDSFQVTSSALIEDLGKLMLTPVLFMFVNHLNVESVYSNKIFCYLKDMSFFAYAGHFLFCSMLMHTAAPFLGFMTTGKFTVLVFIFIGVGIPVMAGIYWVGKRYLPHIMKLFDGSL